jgi:hypothetical protein
MAQFHRRQVAVVQRLEFAGLDEAVAAGEPAGDLGRALGDPAERLPRLQLLAGRRQVQRPRAGRVERPLVLDAH